MSVELLFQQLQKAGVIFNSDNGKITLKLPKDLDTDLKRALSANKDALKGFLERIYKREKQEKPAVTKAKDNEQLSFAQQRLWMIDKIQSGSAEYNMPQAYKVTGPLNLNIVERAFQQIITRHQVLRTVYLESDSGPIQKVLNAFDFNVQTHDISKLSLFEKDLALAQIMEKDAQQPFELSLDLMLRVSYVLVESGSREAHRQQLGYLLFNMHHIASDGWSMEILSQEFFSLYHSFSTNLEASLQPLEIQYSDYAAWQRSWLKGEVLEKQLGYWEKQLEDIPPVHSLPLCFDRPPRKEYVGNSLSDALPSDIAYQIQQVSKEAKLTPFMVLHSALALTLSKFSGEHQVVVGTPIANRQAPEFQSLIGFFVNTLILKTSCQFDSLNDYFQHVRETHLEAQLNQDVPFEQIVESLNLERNPAHSPLFQIVLTTNSDFGVEAQQSNEQISFNGLTIESEVPEEPITKFDIELNLSISDDGINITWLYDKSIFSESFIARLNTHLSAVIKKIGNSYGQLAQIRLNSVNELQEGEFEKLQDLMNSQYASEVDTFSVIDCFKRQVDSNPNKVAIIDKARSFSFSMIDALSTQLAVQFLQLGVKPQGRVGLMFGSSVEMIVGMLASLKLNCAYVPLNPQYPTSRLQFIIDDIDADILVTSVENEQIANTVNADFKVINEHFKLDLNVKESVSELPSSPICPKDPAYVIYTSGSTGNPKGVVVPNRGITRLVLEQNYIALNQDTIFLQAANVAFDAATLEIWGPLLNGGTCVIYPEQHIELDKLNRVIQKHQVNAIWLTAGLFSEWSKSCAGAHSLKHVLAGGDVLNPQAVKRVHTLLPNTQVINGYGPTENTTFTACYPIPRSFDDTKPVPIGRALAGDKVMIMNQGGLAPFGTIGELCVSGPGLASSYLNLPQMTAEKFTANPYTSESNLYEKLYKTGDLVKYNQNGLIEYIGRMDDQLKIRGFRVELSEIQSQLLDLEHVEDALLIAKEQQGQKRLYAYFELTETAKAKSQSNTYWYEVTSTLLANVLPDYMVPSAQCIVEQWPLTSNGKIDKRALPNIEITSDKAYIPAETSNEQALVSVCSELLALSEAEISLGHNFFELGGHSLLVIRLVAQLKDNGLHIDSPSVFEAKTLGDIANRLKVLDEVVTFMPSPSLIPAYTDRLTPEMINLMSLTQAELDDITASISGGAANIQDIYPLAPLQQGILAVHSLTEGRDPYVTTIGYEFSELAHLDTLKDQLNIMIERHDVLRTCILWRGREEAVQVVQRRVRCDVDWISLGEGPDIKSRFDHYVESGAHRIEFESAPLLQLQAVKDQAEGKYYVVLKVHHLLIDHVSLDIIMEEITQMSVEGIDSLPPVTPYRHFIEKLLQDADKYDSEAYFKEKLSTFDEPAYPYGLKEVMGSGENIQELKGQLPEALCRRIRMQMKTLNMSPAALFHLCWAMITANTSGQHDVVFGTVLSGRMNGIKGMDRLLGMMINTLPVRVDVSSGDTLTLLSELDKQLKSLLIYEQTSLTDAMSCSGIENNTALFSAVLNYRHSHQAGEEDANADVKLLGVKERTNYPFMLCVDDLGEGFALDLQIDSSVSAHSVMAYVQTALEQLLDALNTEPKAHTNNSAKKRVSALPILPLDEQNLYLNEWNNTEVEYKHTLCIQQGFETQVKKTPNAIAIQFDGASLTYSELNERANQLAHYLRHEHKVAPDTLVGLCVERSLEMVVGIWGILKAGGAYVPIDPELPPSRLAYLIEDSATDVVLSHSQVKEKVNFGDATVVMLDNLDITPYPSSDINIDEIGLRENNLAYMIYTSGSTGNPKGVLIEHKALHNRVDWMDKEYGCDETDKILQKTPYSFDVSVWEFIWPMLKGAQLVVAKPGGHKEPNYLSHVIEHYSITKLHFVPSMLGIMLEHGDLSQCTSLKQVFCSGEALQISHVTEFQKRLPHAQLHNLYGPTEAAIDVSYWDCKGYNGNSVPIGKPIQNIQLYIMDEYLNLVPNGACGELHIGGDGLARGYLNRESLTKERFVRNPYFDPSEANSSPRLYKTGDLVRYREDGNIEYIGRLDHQVKIRGFRIELGEIEYQIAQEEQIDSALVVDVKDEMGQQSLVAYAKSLIKVESSEDELALSEHIKQALGKALPEYMVPNHIVFLNDWPLTPNGKIDRKALPKVDIESSAAAFELPETETEILLAEVWGKILKLDSQKIGKQANFFDLGGHSLLVMKLAQTIDQVFRTHGISINNVIQSPTLSGMSSVIDSFNNSEWQALRKVGESSQHQESIIYIAPGAGMTSSGYIDVARGMPHIQFMSLEPVGMSPNDPVIDSWDELIDEYVEAIQSNSQLDIQNGKTIYIMGHSSGGSVAFETALRLESHGCKTEVLLCECLVATDEQAEFDLSDEDKQAMMVSYAQQLKPEDSEQQLLNWVNLPMTKRLFNVYFQQVDWGRDYQPKGSLKGQVYMVLTDQEPEEYWQEKQMQLERFTHLPIMVKKTSGEHVTMMKMPHASNLAVEINNIIND